MGHRQYCVGLTLLLLATIASAQTTPTLTGRTKAASYQDLTHIANNGAGAPTDGTVQLHDGSGAAFGLHLADEMLTGSLDETALLLAIDVAKSAGNAIALDINVTDTASPAELLTLRASIDGVGRLAVAEWAVRIHRNAPLEMVDDADLVLPGGPTKRYVLSYNSWYLNSALWLQWSYLAYSQESASLYDVSLGRYDDGTDSYLCVGDGDRTGCDGRLMADTITADLITTDYTPTSSAESCTPGTWAGDDDYLYRCTTAGTWGRVAIATGW